VLSRRAEDHERVGGHRRRVFHDERIHVDLGHGGMVCGDARQRADSVRQRRAIHGRQATEIVEQHGRSDPRKHALDIPVIERRHAERDVFVSLSEDAADAEDDDRTEQRIALHTDHELARSADHPFDEQHGVLTFGERQERACGGPDGVVAAKIQGDQAALRLVTDVRSDRLDGHRTAELPGDGLGLVLGACNAAFGNGDPVAGEQRLRLPFVQRAAPVGYGFGHDRRRIASGGRRQRRLAAFARHLPIHACSSLNSRATTYAPARRMR
jgi:hypothetical protein